jgi:uncharacterized membrane protein
MRRTILTLTLTLALAGCGPNLRQRVAPYPPEGKSPEAFSVDDASCASWAHTVASTSVALVATRVVVGGALGAGLGAGLGALAGSIVGDPYSGAALGATEGAVIGGVAGLTSSALDYDRSATEAYRNCMAAKGYVVR